jgi:hypothetical protein
VAPGLRLGRLPTRGEWEAAGRPRLLSLCAELQTLPVPGARCVPMLDLTVPTALRLQRAVAVIEGQRRSGQAVWVCCALGFSRSAASVIGWLGLHGAAGTMAGAHEAVRRARPQIVLRPAWLAALDRLATSGKTRDE